jgi:hypothetical protein
MATAWIPGFTWLFGHAQAQAQVMAQQDQQQQQPQPPPPIVSGMGNMAVRVYLPELKARLKKEFRAQRAECCLDFNDAEQCAAFSAHRERLVQNVMNTDRERQAHEMDDDSLGIAHQRLQLRQDRLINDLDCELALQNDYVRTQTLAAVAKK